jgi:hypothetical protein
MAEGTGLHALGQLQQFAAARSYNVDEPEVPQEWLNLLRGTFDLVEKEMLRMNGALAYAAGHMDLTSSGVASDLRGAREDFLFHGKSFEQEEMWSLRSWYWVWKMQGFPENGYQMIKDKMTSNLSTFDTIQKNMWEAYGEPSYEFSHATRGTANRRMSDMRTAVS